MDERTLIARYFDRRASARSDVVTGIGDDAAILRMEPGWDLLVATDSLLAGTHFPLNTPAASIGHRVLAVNLSDIAAMGGEPVWCSLALSLPAIEEAWMQDFADGFFKLADRCSTALVGGDTVHGPLGATVTVHGRVRPGEGIRRTGARPGDGIWVTGHPGDAVAGRHLLTATPRDVHETRLRNRFLFPEPRLNEGRGVAALASAMIDVSDGLHDDIVKLTQASDVGADLDVGLLPLSSSLREIAPVLAIEYALTGGDDYELCFTVPQSSTPQLLEIAGRWTTPITRIGTIADAPGVRWTQSGRTFTVPGSTFRHFR